MTITSRVYAGPVQAASEIEVNMKLNKFDKKDQLKHERRELVLIIEGRLLAERTVDRRAEQPSMHQHQQCALAVQAPRGSSASRGRMHTIVDMQALRPAAVPGRFKGTLHNPPVHAALYPWRERCLCLPVCPARG